MKLSLVSIEQTACRRGRTDPHPLLIVYNVAGLEGTSPVFVRVLERAKKQVSQREGVGVRG